MPQNRDKQVHLAVKALKIGSKAKELRQKHRYTLHDVATKTGLSKPFLSRIENDHVVPPVATLLRLARSLNVGLSHFFQDVEDRGKISITRRSERVRLKRHPRKKGDANYIYLALETKKSNKHMEPLLVEFPVQGAEELTDLPFMSHEGEEFLYVMEGRIEFRTVDRVELLEAGDSIYFESDIGHSFRCVGDKPARALAVIWSPV
jgi:transcriptional regulator with XRE-family HTH domain